jgi:hypothetical protein
MASALKAADFGGFICIGDDGFSQQVRKKWDSFSGV